MPTSPTPVLDKEKTYPVDKKDTIYSNKVLSAVEYKIG